VKEKEEEEREREEPEEEKIKEGIPIEEYNEWKMILSILISPELKIAEESDGREEMEIVIFCMG
jgi:hypothetical protein